MFYGLGQKVAQDLRSGGFEAIFEKLDVTQEAEWQHVVQQVLDKWGKIDILVNNAGIFSTDGVEKTSLSTWAKVLAVNQTGVFLGMKAVLPYMREHKSGSIINTSSIYGMIGSGTSAAYQATKGAIRIITKTAAIEYAPYSVRVNSIHPGIIDTEMIASLKASGELDAFKGYTALPRLGTAQDIAYGVLYLASEESSFVTGSELVIDGGYTAQ